MTIPPTKLAIFAKMAKKQAQKVAQFVLISAAVSRDGRKANKKRNIVLYKFMRNSCVICSNSCSFYNTNFHELNMNEST